MNCELNQDQQSISELHMNAQSIYLLRNYDYYHHLQIRNLN